jgi:4-amino-4-deoxy-L-arabinose transferase-like glycosyltransferase
VTAADGELLGPAPRWSRQGWALLMVLALAGLALRLHGLSAEGLADDEVHKWLAANRYLHGVFSGDDVEHPMLMKDLIALAILVGRPLGLALETMTRLPNALAGGISVVVVGLLGRRLFGEAAALVAAGLAAFSATLVGYQRIAKEDTLLGLFLMLLLLWAAEALAAADDGRAADARRYESWGAVALAAMLASKYFFFLAPIPLVFYLWVRRDTTWRMPPRRWLELSALALMLLLCLSWTPLLPSTWEYARSYTSGQQTVHGSLSFMGRIYPNLVGYWLAGTPPWFYAVFAAVKLAPLTVAFALGGLVVAIRRRRPAHVLVLSWLAVWFVVHSLPGSKWGRFFVAVLPAFLLLAGYFATLLLALLRAGPRRWAATAIALLLVGGEAVAAIRHAPHYRLYVSALGGGDARVSWYFPHCDYFDAGFREAVQFVALHAEPGAELVSEIDWPARLYAEAAGRSDLRLTLLRRPVACRDGRVCYVALQVGRTYAHNQDAVASLASRTPWHVESLEGREVVKVYRLQPGESPFPAADYPPPPPGRP